MIITTLKTEITCHERRKEISNWSVIDLDRTSLQNINVNDWKDFLDSQPSALRAHNHPVFFVPFIRSFSLSILPFVYTIYIGCNFFSVIKDSTCLEVDAAYHVLS